MLTAVSVGGLASASKVDHDPLVRRIGVRRQVLAGTIVFFVVRLALSGFRAGPLLVADEAGYLTNARVLMGGVPGQMTIAPFYRGGYSLLLAPLSRWLDVSSVTYHLILAVNALLATSARRPPLPPAHPGDARSTAGRDRGRRRWCRRIRA